MSVVKNTGTICRIMAQVYRKSGLLSSCSDLLLWPAELATSSISQNRAPADSHLTLKGDLNPSEVYMRQLSAVLLLALFTPAAAVVAQRSAIPSGTEITVRTDEPIDADVQSADTSHLYRGTIAKDVIGRDGNVLIPRGSRAQLAAIREDNA